MLILLILTGIALVCGVVIFFVDKLVPHKVKGIEKTEEIAGILPGINCAACGFPGCFAYAQALTANPDLISEGECAVILSDAEGLARLQNALGATLDASSIRRRALIHCNGNSEVIYDYSGVETCRGAAQLLSGYKKCPYACLGFGDCAEVCPQDAISIRTENGVAVVDPEKCNGCGLCVAVCSMNLIELVPAETKIAFLCNYIPVRDIPDREKCDAGCTHCRKCLRACEYQAIEWDKERAIPQFDIEKCVRCNECIETCEPRTLVYFDEIKAGARPESSIASK